jgi:peptide/nickel transport system ATP-binding protein
MTPVLSARGVSARYVSSAGPDVEAIDGVSLDLLEGEVLGLAGESGCGKSTFASVVALTALPPLEVVAGEMEVDGDRVDVTRLGQLPRQLRGKLVALLPQGAMNSLNPTSRVRDLAFDVIRAHESHIGRDEAAERTRDRLEQLSLPVRALDSYPHQLSGGMRQRVVAVISTLLNPVVLVADEPSSALDVSAQHMLVKLLRQLLEQQLVRSIMFITHDLPLLSTFADRIAIMYAGRVAELGPTREIVDRPQHPYTRALVETVLAPEPAARRRRIEGIPCAPPDLRHPPPGCRFAPRCKPWTSARDPTRRPSAARTASPPAGGSRTTSRSWNPPSEGCGEHGHPQRTG